MYELPEEETVSIIKNWLDKEGLQLIKLQQIQRKTHAKQQEAVFFVFEFKPHHNLIMLSLQYCKLKRKSHEPVQECMDRLCMKAVECEYREYGRRPTEQFINGLDDDVILGDNKRANSHKRYH